MSTPDFWTPAKVALLKRECATGVSARVIGERLGVTKNAVIGKLRRLKLLLGRHRRIRVLGRNLPPPPPPPPPPLPPPPRLPHVAKAPPGVTEIQYWPTGDGASLLAVLPSANCRWPKGDPASADFTFCAGTKYEDYSYCYTHCKEVYKDFRVRR